MKRLSILYFIIFFSDSFLIAQQKKYRLEIGIQKSFPERIFNKTLKSYDNRNQGYGFSISLQNYGSKNLVLSGKIEYNHLLSHYNGSNSSLGYSWYKVQPAFDIFSVSQAIRWSPTKNKIKPSISLGFGCFHALYCEPILMPEVISAIGASYKRTINLSIEFKWILGDMNTSRLGNYNLNPYILSINVGYSFGLFNSIEEFKLRNKKV